MGDSKQDNLNITAFKQRENVEMRMVDDTQGDSQDQKKEHEKDENDECMATKEVLKKVDEILQ